MIIEKTTGMILFLLLSAGLFADEPPLPTQTYKSYSVPQKSKKKCISAWREEELAGYRFDLISDTYIESFSFKKEDNGAFEVRCVYGKRGGPVTGPIEYWHIDTDGYLCIYEEPDKSKNAKKIGKIYINHEEELLYALKRNKIVRYTYRRLCD